MWLSLVEHLVRDEGVGGSIPLIPTIQKTSRIKAFFTNFDPQKSY